MKKLLLSLFILPAIGWGQKKDDVHLRNDFEINTIWILGKPLKNDTISNSDTTACLILYSDTATLYTSQCCEYDTVQLYGGGTALVGKYYHKPYYNNSVRWMQGYKVINYYQGIGYLYLDENKKRLSNTIVVWMVK